jgi:hypothetical protein
MNTLKFTKAFKYPFNRPVGLLNILWFLVPIVGWLALFGYQVRIIKEFCDQKFEELPLFSFKEDMKLGFKMMIKMIPFMLCYVLMSFVLALIISPNISSSLNMIISLFAVPVLAINFTYKQTVQSFFEFSVLKSVVENPLDYVLALLKSIVLAIVFFVMMIILVGIPANAFTKNIFLADFYGRKVK